MKFFKVTNIYKRIKAAVRYKKAVRMANKALTVTHQRQYVMPLSFEKKTLLIIDRENMRRYKRKHIYPDKVSVRALEDECFYCTPYDNGSGQLSDAILSLKKHQFLSWFMA